MKTTRILAGMSAVAFAASMLTMVNASATTEVTNEMFGVQVYAMGSTKWNWKSASGDFGADGTVTVTGNAATLATESGDDTIGDTGIQVYYSGTALASNEELTATVEYKLDGEGDNDKSGTIDFKIDGYTLDSNNNLVTTVTESIAGYGSSWEDFSKYGEFTLTATISDIKVSEVEEIEYSLPATIEVGGDYAGDWADAGDVDYRYLAELSDGADLEVTVNYTIDNTRYTAKDDQFYSLKPMDMNGWGAVSAYTILDGDTLEPLNEDDESYKEATISGITLKDQYLLDNDLLETGLPDEFDEYPLLQNDGYILLDDESTSVTFTLSAEAVQALIETAEADHDDSTEDVQTYGGLGFQTHGVTITSIVVSEAKEEETDEPCICGCDCTADTCDEWDTEAGQCGCGCADAVELDAYLKFTTTGWFPSNMSGDYSITSTKINGDGEYTLEYSGEYLDDSGNTATSTFTDAGVFTIDVADVYAEAKEDAEKLYEDFDIYVNSIKVTAEDGTETELISDAEAFNEFYDEYTDTDEEDSEYKLEGHVENTTTTNYRVDLYNTYGSTGNMIKAAVDGSDVLIDNTKVSGSKIVIDFTVSGLGEMSGDCSCAVCQPADDDDDSTESTESTADSTASSSTAATSNTSSTSSVATKSGSDTNPDTGAVALGMVGVVLAGAAMAVSKKKD